MYNYKVGLVYMNLAMGYVGRLNVQNALSAHRIFTY